MAAVHQKPQSLHLFESSWVQPDQSSQLQSLVAQHSLGTDEGNRGQEAVLMLWPMDGRISTDYNFKEASRRKSSSPLISLEYASGQDPLGRGQNSNNNSALSRKVFESFMFNLEEIERATQSITEVNLLGKSNVSSVYKGILRDGSVAAIKCIEKSSCKSDESEFLKGLKMLTFLKHENLVRLRGFCCSKGRGQCFFIYEFVPNGNLLQYLDVKDETEEVLEWTTRVSIINKIARGIVYLHGENGNKPEIVHQNLSTEKILIDHWYNPSLADSGLHKLFTDDIIFSKLKASAAMGYLAPEYITTGRLTDKSDVYAFGMIMLQILSGKSKISHLIILQAVESGRLNEDFMDHNLLKNFPEAEAAHLARLGLLCILESSNQRPSMEDVMQELNKLAANYSFQFIKTLAFDCPRIGTPRIRKNVHDVSILSPSVADVLRLQKQALFRHFS